MPLNWLLFRMKLARVEQVLACSVTENSERMSAPYETGSVNIKILQILGIYIHPLEFTWTDNKRNDIVLFLLFFCLPVSLLLHFARCYIDIIIHKLLQIRFGITFHWIQRINPWKQENLLSYKSRDFKTVTKITNERFFSHIQSFDITCR